MAQVRYIVNNVDEAVAFYCEHLGFKLEQQYGPAMAIVSHEQLHLWLAGPTASASKSMPDGREPTPGGWNRIVVTVDDLDSRIIALKAIGTTFRNDVVSGPGGQQILCDDPSGKRD